jgi:hypothetical protein
MCQLVQPHHAIAVLHHLEKSAVVAPVLVKLSDGGEEGRKGRKGGREGREGGKGGEGGKGAKDGMRG